MDKTAMKVILGRMPVTGLKGLTKDGDIRVQLGVRADENAKSKSRGYLLAIRKALAPLVKNSKDLEIKHGHENGQFHILMKDFSTFSDSFSKFFNKAESLIKAAVPAAIIKDSRFGYATSIYVRLSSSAFERTKTDLILKKDGSWELVEKSL